MYVYYTYTYTKELCQQFFIYSEEAQCTSHTSCFQMLELPQSHFGDDWDIVCMITHVVCPSCFSEFLELCVSWKNMKYNPLLPRSLHPQFSITKHLGKIRVHIVFTKI